MTRLAIAATTLLLVLACGEDAAGGPATPATDAGRDVDVDAVSALDCAAADTSSAPQALHAAAAQVLTQASPCGLSICHDGDRPESGLGLLGVADLRAALVDKPSCQAPTLPLVDADGGNPALANSWLWQKLVAPANSSGALTASADFGQSASCAQEPGEPFGVRMPKGSLTLSDERLFAIRDWICAGAPGP